ncbi:MAG TPA: VOC family protein, partial [Propionibacteriaceae bacterium]|nr:VOC family protein [Propionibacteriaceae bacterium]
ANDSEGNGVAGLMDVSNQTEAPPPNWIFYLAVADADSAAAEVREAGGSVVAPPADIPGTGRFAVCADPQGAVFGVLAPAPMDGGAPTVGAYADDRAGHGTWHELATSDPDAAAEFYGTVFGWTKSTAMEMGDSGTYQMLAADGHDLAGIMGLMGAPRPSWGVVFGVDSVTGAVDAARAAGATVVREPMEVPGDAWAAYLIDPQGAYFAVSGPR